MVVELCMVHTPFYWSQFVLLTACLELGHSHYQEGEEAYKHSKSLTFFKFFQLQGLTSHLLSKVSCVCITTCKCSKEYHVVQQIEKVCQDTCPNNIKNKTNGHSIVITYYHHW